MQRLRKYSVSEVYTTKYFLYKYNEDLSKLVKLKFCRNKGFENIKINYNDIVNKEEVERISLSRTKRNIREIALCNNFDYFLTFTINSKNCDRFSLDACQNTLKKLIKAYKRKYNDFSYVIITEKHKNGAFHFHGLCKGLNNNDLYINNNCYLSSHFFDKLGFNSFSMIKDYNKCCNYITKYITKDCVKNSHNQIYIVSRGLKKANRIELKELIDSSIQWDFTNDYCCIKNIKEQEL